MNFSNEFVFFSLFSNVAGFIWVTDINFERYDSETFFLSNATVIPNFASETRYCFHSSQRSKKITYLAPSAGSLPGKFLIVGNLTWCE